MKCGDKKAGCRGPDFLCADVDESGCVNGVQCCSMLRQSLEQYNIYMLDAAPFVCHLRDLENGIVACNQETVRLFGVSSKEEYIARFSELSPEIQPDGSLSREKSQVYIQQAMEQGTCRFEWLHQTLQGEPIPVEVTLVRVPFDGKAHVAAYMRDLGQIRHLETTLHTRNQELALGNDLLRTVNTVAQILLSSDDGGFDHAVWSVLTLLGQSTNVQRVYIWQNHTSDDGRLYCDQVYEWSEGAEPQQDKELAKNISYDEVLPNWKVAFAQGQGINSLVRKMSASEQDQLVPQGIISILVQPIKLSTSVWGFIGFDDCVHERTWSEGEISILKACGILIASSIQKHRVAEDLVRAKIEAEEATAAKGDFLARMSHEIRTPMNAILGLAYLCLQSSLDPLQRSYVTKMQAAAQNLLGIINDILDFSKIEARKLDIIHKPFLVQQVLDGVLNVIHLKAQEKHLALECRLDAAVPPRVLGDALRLHQILLNLCSNAVKFTDQGEIVLSVTAKSSGGNAYDLRFAVSDTGPGVTPEEQSRLFLPFSQADDSITRRHGGTGLGLVISRQLVELMGGVIELHSIKGKGSKFSFSFPCMGVHEGEDGDEVLDFLSTALAPAVGDAPASVNDEAAEHTVSVLQGCRVLLVEDNDINQLIAESLLTQAGMLVTIACNGLEACEKIAQAPFDIVLMDIQMPLMDGFEATRRIRAKTQNASYPPIIAMTAHAMDRDKERALNVGMNGYISKPFDPLQLISVLAMWIQKTEK